MLTSLMMTPGSFSTLGRFLILVGLLLIFFGAGLILLPRLGFFRLPGDIVIERRNLVVYIPVVSSIVLSLILTLIFNLVLRRW